jgi:hypothetical protein
MSEYTFAPVSGLQTCKASASPLDLSLLGAHLASCHTSLGRMFRVRCLAESIHGFVAARIVTTLFGVTAVVLLGSAFV